MPEVTLDVVRDTLALIVERLIAGDERLTRMADRLDRIDGRLDRIEGRLDRVDEHLQTITDRIAHQERLSVEVLTVLRDHAARMDRMEYRLSRSHIPTATA